MAGLGGRSPLARLSSGVRRPSPLAWCRQQVRSPPSIRCFRLNFQGRMLQKQAATAGSTPSDPWGCAQVQAGAPALSNNASSIPRSTASISVEHRPMIWWAPASGISSSHIDKGSRAGSIVIEASHRGSSKPSLRHAARLPRTTAGAPGGTIDHGLAISAHRTSPMGSVVTVSS